MLIVLCGECRDVITKYGLEKHYAFPPKFVCKKCGPCENVYLVGKHEFEIMFTIDDNGCRGCNAL